MQRRFLQVRDWAAALGAGVSIGLTGCGLMRPAPMPQVAAPNAVAALTPPAEVRPAPPPDAVPRVERLREGMPNHRYTIKGEDYEPHTHDVAMAETGIASWYGHPFHGRRTANGEVYDMHAMTAAHKTMPLPSYARVRNPANGREVIVRVNDRGPFKPGRVIDLSLAAAKRLRISGIAPVQVQRLTHEEIRTGAWRHLRPSASGPAPAARRSITRDSTG